MKKRNVNKKEMEKVSVRRLLSEFPLKKKRILYPGGVNLGDFIYFCRE